MPPSTPPRSFSFPPTRGRIKAPTLEAVRLALATHLGDRVGTPLHDALLEAVADPHEPGRTVARRNGVPWETFRDAMKTFRDRLGAAVVHESSGDWGGDDANDD